jgi:hypothetical protein
MEADFRKDVQAEDIPMERYEADIEQKWNGRSNTGER